MTIQKLHAGQLSVHTDDSLFTFNSSDELQAGSKCIGQQRAVEVLRSALSVEGEGFHVIVAGREGTGRLECLQSLIEELAQTDIEQKDRLLLPQNPEASRFEEIALTQEETCTFLSSCRSIVGAVLKKKTGIYRLELKKVKNRFAGYELLSDYCCLLETISNTLLKPTQDNISAEQKIRRLNRVLPVLLHSSVRASQPCLQDPFPDISSLLGSAFMDPQSGRREVHAGTLIQASGGFLLLNARQLVKDAGLWQLLLEIFKTGLIPLNRLIPVQQLNDEYPVTLFGHIRLTARIILLCDGATLDSICDTHPGIENIFPVITEFESEMPRTEAGVHALAELVAALQRKYQCMPLDAGAMACLTDHAVRYTDCQHRITLNRTELSKYVREASLLAKQSGTTIISRSNIKEVIARGLERFTAERRDALKAIIAGETRVELLGNVVGQINSLTMVGTGVQTYLEPSRITATVRTGEGAVVDIEREVNLGGAIHSKGVMILSSLLAARYSRHTQLSLIATLVFEQSYSDVDGDSASAAEMMAVLSAITEIPLKQELAITGSIDQRGQILCVGDINSKIEGFFQLIQQHGDLPDAGVVIPAGNLLDLMLNDEVIHAVETGSFRIYAVSTLDDLIELYSGIEAGKEGDDHAFPQGSFNAQVQFRLKQFAEEKKDDHKDDHKDD